VREIGRWVKSETGTTVWEETGTRAVTFQKKKSLIFGKRRGNTSWNLVGSFGESLLRSENV